MPLLILTTQSCVSKPKAEIVLPPKPEREEMPEVKTMADIAQVLNYYEHLVQKWEAWGQAVEDITSENP